MPLYPFHCGACDREWEQWQKMTEQHVAPCCGRIWERVFSFETLPSTSKDKAYEFIRADRKGNPVEIRSRGQYRKYLKDNGRADMAGQKLSSFRRSESNWNEILGSKRRHCAHRIAQRIQKEGLMDGFRAMAGRR